MTKNEALDILGLKPGASSAEIKAAYRRLVLKFHGDQGGSDALMRQITEAYETLTGKRPETRKSAAPGPSAKPAQSSGREEAEAKRRAEEAKRQADAKRRADEKAARERAAKAAEDERRAAAARKAEKKAGEAKRERQAKEAQLKAAREQAERDRQERARREAETDRATRRVYTVLGVIAVVVVGLFMLANLTRSDRPASPMIANQPSNAAGSVSGMKSALLSGQIVSGRMTDGPPLRMPGNIITFYFGSETGSSIVTLHNVGFTTVPNGGAVPEASKLKAAQALSLLSSLQCSAINPQNQLSALQGRTQRFIETAALTVSCTGVYNGQRYDVGEFISVNSQGHVGVIRN